MNFKALTEKIKQFSIENKKQFAVIITVVIVFIFLVIFNSDNETIMQENIEVTTSSSLSSLNDVQKEIEKQLEEIIGNINGTGNVKVMVSLDSSGEFVYAENSKKEDNGDKSSLDSEIVIYESDEGNDEGLIVSVKSPEISGVAVVCDGGNSSVIRAEITELVTSLFGIGSDRVYVGSNVR